MIEITVRAEIEKLNLIEKSCIVFLYGIALQNAQEIGRFFIDRIEIENEEFEKYVNQAEQTINEKFIQQLINTTLTTLDGSIKVLMRESNKS